MTLYRALTTIAAAIGTHRCTRARAIGAAERYQRFVAAAVVVVEDMTVPFRA
jgi:hypothetical protein